jgi:uroporphyrinogen decarboxylase
MKGLGAGLVDDGWEVEEVVVYETDEVAVVPPSAARLAAGEFPALVLRSPTAVRAVARHVSVLPAGTVPVCGGPTTAAAVAATWDAPAVVSDEPTAQAVAHTVAAVLAAGRASGEGRGDDDA